MTENETTTAVSTEAVAAANIADALGLNQVETKKVKKPRKIQPFELAPYFGCRVGAQAGEINKALCELDRPATLKEIAEHVNANGVARVSEGRCEGHLNFWLNEKTRGVGRYLKADLKAGTYWLAE